jgi:ABC-type multidrug transport system ATPase subunit
MRRRIDLAASLVGRPQVLFLDEPTTGVDPASRRDLWNLIRELVDDGTTVVLTTQYLEEADRLAHRVGVIDQGRLVSEGTAEELKDRIGGQSSNCPFRTMTTLGRSPDCTVSETLEATTVRGEPSSCTAPTALRPCERCCAVSTLPALCLRTSGCAGTRWTMCSSP